MPERVLPDPSPDVDDDDDAMLAAPPLYWQYVAIESEGSQDTGVCDCCGMESRLVWGRAGIDGTTFARYYVHWTLGHVACDGAHFDLILGPWDDGTPDEDRRSVSLAYRLFESGPSFMVIDAPGRPFCRMPTAGIPLTRSQVIGTPLAELAFAVVDAICFKDDRIAELVPGR